MDKEERRKAMALRATVQIGKDGITEAVRRETIDQVKKNGMVKVRFNFSGEDISAFANSLADHALLVMSVGRTLVFKKREK